MDSDSAIATNDLPAAMLGLLLRAGRTVTLQAVRGVPGAKLTPPQFRILYFLSQTPGASLSQVAAHLGVRLPTASVMVVRLEKDGHLERRRDPTSRRRMQLSLSERGAEVMAQARCGLDGRLQAALAELEAQEQELLSRSLPLFSRILDKL